MENQHPLPFCDNEALAVGILPHEKKSKTSKVHLVMAIIGGILGGIVVLGLVVTFVRRSNADKTTKRKKPTTRLIAEKASTVYTSKLRSAASKTPFYLVL
ncbi:hypothetical protein V6N11_019185 [Hibiscus sabdariffa]|uniref:Uncharacterized protein n=1 Tax=Hibiscus sabdariffa TaxID=183260 RepID=A0ABR2R1P5_9ROSI